MKRPFLLAILTGIMVVSGGCASTPRAGGPYDTSSDAPRDPLRAQALTAQAIEVMADDPEEAEQLLREALSADLYDGKAHNNLGALLLRKDDLYGAAQEFQWAARLMPGHPDPRLNLAQTFERAGRVDEALSYYDTALEVYPGHIPTIQALARCQLRHGRPDDRTDQLLRDVAFTGESSTWRDWARLQLVRREAR